jgi:hypothetical protein
MGFRTDETKEAAFAESAGATPGCQAELSLIKFSG